MAKAWDMLHNPEVVGNMKTEPYMDLCRAAGYSEDAVQKAAKDWANKRLDRGLEV